MCVCARMLCRSVVILKIMYARRDVCVRQRAEPGVSAAENPASPKDIIVGLEHAFNPLTYTHTRRNDAESVEHASYPTRTHGHQHTLACIAFAHARLSARVVCMPVLRCGVVWCAKLTPDGDLRVRPCSFVQLHVLRQGRRAGIKVFCLPPGRRRPGDLRQREGERGTKIKKHTRADRTNK